MTGEGVAGHVGFNDGGVMANPSPYQGRMRRKRRRKPGGLAALTRVLWQALLEAEEILLAEDSEPEMRLRAANTLSQASLSYLRLIETGEYEARLRAIEEKLPLVGRKVW
jgi:hypothetical protein